MPECVRMNARQILALCATATEAQRRAAIDRARQHIPFLLPQEEGQAEQWALYGKQSDL